MEDCVYNEVCTQTICNSDCIRYKEMSFLLESSNIPKKRQKPVSLIPGVDYDAFCELADIKLHIVNAVDSGFNLLIASNETGNGKTSWSIKLLLKYFDQIWAGNGFRIRGYFQHVPTLFNTLKDFSDSHDALKSVLKNADIVVWDDIAGAKLTDYDISQLIMLLDERILNEKANIYTCNVASQQQLEKAVGTRLASRIWNCSKKIILNGKDRRNG